MALLSDILIKVSSYTDQEAVLPTGSDLTTRISYANTALNEWSDYDDWEDLTSTYSFSVTTDGATSLSLPATFRKPMSPLAIYNSNEPTLYPIIPMDERFTENTGNKYCYVTGNLDIGFTLNIPTGLSSGVSAVMDIQSFPTALLSTNNIVPTKSSAYVAQRIISLVLESRGDDRFPTAKYEADIKLAGMSEAQNAGNLGMNNQIPMPKSFTIGVD